MKNKTDSSKPDTIVCESYGDGFRVISPVRNLVASISFLLLYPGIALGPIFGQGHPRFKIFWLIITIGTCILSAMWMHFSKRIVTIDRSNVATRFKPLPLPERKYSGSLTAIALPKASVGWFKRYPVLARFSDGKYVYLIENVGDAIRARSISELFAKSFSLDVTFPIRTPEDEQLFPFGILSLTSVCFFGFLAFTLSLVLSRCAPVQ